MINEESTSAPTPMRKCTFKVTNSIETFLVEGTGINWREALRDAWNNHMTQQQRDLAHAMECLIEEAV